MTNLEALTATLNFPCDDNKKRKILIDRELDEAATYAKSDAFQLAYADYIMVMVLSANVSEGGFSLSIVDKEKYLNIANAIYAEQGEAQQATPKVTNKSYLW